MNDHPEPFGTHSRLDVATALADLFVRYNLKVSVGIQPAGISILSQDERVEAAYISPVVVQRNEVYNSQVAERRHIAAELSRRWVADVSDPCSDLLDRLGELNAVYGETLP